MDSFLYYLTSGICWGAVIALIALGYTLVYGIIKLINFAHGEFYMVGAYAGFGAWTLYQHLAYGPAGGTEPGNALAALLRAGDPWLTIPAVLLAAIGAGALVAAVTERVAYKPIRGSGRLSALLTAIGVSFLLQNLFTFVDSGNSQTYTGELGRLCQSRIAVGSGGVLVIQVVFIFVTLGLTAGLWYVVMRTRFGCAMRAVSQDPDAAALMGIDTDRVIRRTFILGGGMAGVAGALVGMYSLVEPMMGFMPGLKAFVAAVVGGIGSIPGAVVGGFLIGLLENLVLWIGVPSGYKDVAAFVLLILVLIVRPSGLLGRPEREKV